MIPAGRKGAALALFFLLTLCLFSLHLFSQSKMLSFDGFYHITYARLYGERGLFTTFPWMHFSIARDYWADHHFLFHVLLIPFSKLGVLAGQKWAGAVFGALALTTCALYLAHHRVRHGWLFAILLWFCSDYFLFRMMMPRAMSLALVCFVLALICMERRKHLWLGVLSFVFVWLYQTALLLVPFAVFAIFWRWSCDRRWELQPLFAVCAGIVAGLTLNPFFPDTFPFLWFHLVSGHTLLQVQIGQEWDPVTLEQLGKLAFPALMLGFVLPLLLLLQSLVKQQQGEAVRWDWWRETGLLWGLTWLMFGLTFFRAIRFLEYAPALGVLLGARLWPWLGLERANGIEQPEPPEESSEIDAELPATDSSTPTLFRAGVARGLRRLCFAALLAFFVVGGEYHRSIAANAFIIRPGVLSPALRWLEKNTPRGTLVFSTEWTLFPLQFAYNPGNRAISGLNPHFFQHWNPALFNTYRRVSLGLDKHPTKTLLGVFGSRHVLLLRRGRDRRLLRQLKKSSDNQTLYRDKFVVVMKLGVKFKKTKRVQQSHPHVKPQKR